jgi:hypothetical protein
MLRKSATAARLHVKSIGVIYLLYFLSAIGGALLAKGLVVPTDTRATATNILAHESLYRSALAVSLIANVVYVALIALLLRLFEPVNRTVSIVAAFLGLTGCLVQIMGGLLQLAPLVMLKEPALMGLFSAGQLQQLAVAFLRLQAQSAPIALVFFALYDLLLGYLIVRSTILPRALGAFVMVAGVGWLAYLYPPLATSLSSVILPVGFMAEFVLMVWLLAKGVDIARWDEIARGQSLGTSA